jgi:5'(3')-deoxyribonucleotidase
MVVPLMQWWGVRIDREDQYPRQFGWDVKGAIVHLLEQQDRACSAENINDMSKEAFWRRLPRSFWRELQPYPTALHFVEFLESGPFDIYILTAHASADCGAAKLDWIDEHLPKYRDRVLLGHPKHVTATPQSILIDDCTKNCEDFARAGGRAIQCPRPWNERWDAPECFRTRPEWESPERRPKYNIIADDLRGIRGQV